MQTRLWLVRPNVRGRNRIDAWLQEGYCAIGWRETGRLSPGVSREEIRERLAVLYPDRSGQSRAAWMGNLDRFINQMEVGDAVITPDGPRLYLGTITSPPRYVGDHDEAHRRDVDWDQPEAPLTRDELSQEARNTLTTMLTVADLSKILPEVSSPSSPGTAP